MTAEQNARMKLIDDAEASMGRPPWDFLRVYGGRADDPETGEMPTVDSSLLNDTKALSDPDTWSERDDDSQATAA